MQFNGEWWDALVQSVDSDVVVVYYVANHDTEDIPSFETKMRIRLKVEHAGQEGVDGAVPDRSLSAGAYFGRALYAQRYARRLRKKHTRAVDALKLRHRQEVKDAHAQLMTELKSRKAKLQAAKTTQMELERNMTKSTGDLERAKTELKGARRLAKRRKAQLVTEKEAVVSGLAAALQTAAVDASAAENSLSTQELIALKQNHERDVHAPMLKRQAEAQARLHLSQVTAVHAAVKLARRHEQRKRQAAKVVEARTHNQDDPQMRRQYAMQMGRKLRERHAQEVRQLQQDGNVDLWEQSDNKEQFSEGLV